MSGTSIVFSKKTAVLVHLVTDFGKNEELTIHIYIYL